MTRRHRLPLRLPLLAAALLAAAAPAAGAEKLAVPKGLESLIQQNIRTPAQRSIAAPDMRRGLKVEPVTAATSARIWTHVRSPAQRGMATRLFSAIGDSLQAGSRKVKVEPQPVQHVAGGPAAAQIRYFKRADRGLAQAAMQRMAQRGLRGFQLLDLSGQYERAAWIRPGHLEIWLPPDFRF